MKEWIKDNIVAFLAILCISCYVGSIAYNYNHAYKETYQWKDSLLQECRRTEKTELTKEYQLTEQTCTKLEKTGYPYKPDTLTVFFELQYAMDYMPIVFPFLLIAAGCYSFSRKYKTGFFKYELTRMSYFTYLQRIFKESWKNIWIVFFFLIFTFLCSYFISGHFNIQATLNKYEIETLVSQFSDRLPLFLTIYFLNIVWNSIFYFNLAIILIKKSYNYLINVVGGILTLYGTVIFFQVGVSTLLFSKVLGISNTLNYFDLFNFWTYLGENSLLSTSVVSISLAIITSIFVLLVYRKKELLVIESEGK